MATLRKQIRDATWVRQSFLVQEGSLDEFARRNRDFSIARFKFGDTTLGGNLVINPPPQFTRNADPKVSGLFSPRPKDGRQVSNSYTKDMGRYYAEAIDENNRVISMRFGVPKFNSLTTFFTGFYNNDLGQLARTGRGGDSIFYTVGKAVGYILPLLYVPLLITNLAGNIGRYLFVKPSSRYYYMKPTMPTYWSAVQGIVNLIAVNKGIIPRFRTKEPGNRLDDRFPFTTDDIEQFHHLLPEIMMEEGGINVYAMATRYQRHARGMYLKMEEMYKKAAGAPNTFDITQELIKLNDDGMRLDMKYNNSPSFRSYLDSWFSNSESQPKTGQVQQDGSTLPNSDTESLPTGKPGDDIAGFKQFMEAELDDGATFISFRVDAEGSVNESFSNTTGASDIQSKMNSISSESRSTSFNFAGGNITDNPIGALVQGAIGAAKNVLTGLADGLSMSGLAALGGSAFTDIPETWQSSVAQLPSMNYSFTLVSPYGNKISQLMNLDVPLAMILAAGLPLSTGPQSYTHPFLVELYDRGRAQTRLGIVDSISISRGVTNLAFDRNGQAMSIKVTFSVKDLSTVMHMPIIQGFSLLSPTASVFDDDNAFTDYMAVLGGLTLADQIYTSERLRLALTRQLAQMRTWFSAAHFANFLGDTTPARIVSLFYTGIVNR